ncbi:MAG: hypothetical protein M3Z66_12105, partial [Chloroflexota bacterium]|nr:hypothetical protein [Chloroflexota bacterium]
QWGRALSSAAGLDTPPLGGTGRLLAHPNVLACGPVPARTAGLPVPWRTWLERPGYGGVAYVGLRAAEVDHVALGDLLRR